MSWYFNSEVSRNRFKFIHYNREIFCLLATRAEPRSIRTVWWKTIYKKHSFRHAIGHDLCACQCLAPIHVVYIIKRNQKKPSYCIHRSHGFTLCLYQYCPCPCAAYRVRYDYQMNVTKGWTAPPAKQRIRPSPRTRTHTQTLIHAEAIINCSVPTSSRTFNRCPYRHPTCHPPAIYLFTSPKNIHSIHIAKYVYLFAIWIYISAERRVDGQGSTIFLAAPKTIIVARNIGSICVHTPYHAVVRMKWTNL